MRSTPQKTGAQRDSQGIGIDRQLGVRMREIALKKSLIGIHVAAST
jgi:hypothetical protein